MASEINIGASLSVSKSGASISGAASKVIDMSGSNNVSSVQELSVAAEAIVLTDITQPYLLYLKNLDATADILVGFANPPVDGTASFKIKAGEFMLLLPTNTTIYAIASAGTPNLQVVASER
jgi:hypothetical protein